jgi:hypothetical protein
VDELDDLEDDETVAAVRTCGPVPLPLDGWDQASVWGWDETTGSLYAHLWHNTDDPAKPPTIRIEPGDYTPTITFAVTLAQHIAMAADCDPWSTLSALLEAAQVDSAADDPPADSEGGTVVTMTEGYSLPEWPYRPQPW